MPAIVATDRPQTAAHHDYYERHGYVVIDGLVPKALIETLLACYRNQIVPSRYPFFRQNTNAYEANVLNGHGYVRQSFLDIHDYARFPDFSRYARDVFCHPAMLAALAEVTGFERFNLMQTMLFDLNAQTPPHQDWYYLDSVPHGNLVAAWIALEDIDERAGRFYVMPESKRLDFGARGEGRTHAQWLKLIRDYVDAHAELVTAPPMARGDVLFWNSRTVHGSLPTRDEAFSRKSLTAHYLPEQFAYGNLFSAKRDLPYKEYSGVRYYRNQPDYSVWNRLKFKLKTTAYNYPLLREGLRGVRDSVNRVLSSGRR